MPKSTTQLAQFDTASLLAELHARQQIDPSGSDAFGKGIIIPQRPQSLVKKGVGIIQSFTAHWGQPDNHAFPLQSSGDQTDTACAAKLTFENTERKFDRTHAVRGVSLQVNSGELICLLGPSGCGKTTLLRLASGIEAPTAGRVLLNDYEVAGPTRFVPPEKRNVGMMFQDFALFPNLTVLENVVYGLKGFSKKLAVQEAFATLARIGLERYAHDYPHILSGGQQQRVALARAIAPRPAVILMDEPFSGLDVYLRDTLRQKTRELLKETRSTGIIVTHDPVEAVQMADRIVVMQDGKILQAGLADDLYRHPSNLFVARLFSEINELPAVVQNGVVEMPFGRFPAPGIADGSRVVLCVRKRAVRPDWKGVQGRVLAVQFQGDTAQLTLGVTGLETPLKSLIQEQMIPAVGDYVMINIDPKDTFIFEVEA